MEFKTDPQYVGAGAVIIGVVVVVVKFAQVPWCLKKENTYSCTRGTSWICRSPSASR